MQNPNILYLHSKSWSFKLKHAIAFMMQKSSIPDAQVFWTSPHHHAPDFWILKPGTKGTWIANPEKRGLFFQVLNDLIAKINPGLIIINDEASLCYITGKKYTLDQCRGSVYFLESGIPCIVLAPYGRVHELRYGRWMWMQDLGKIRRWQTGQQRHEPKFEYTICETNRDLVQAEAFLHECSLIAVDIETTQRHIDTVGFTGLHQEGQIDSFCIPLINPTKPSGLHWSDSSGTANALDIINSINNTAIPKVFQNGSYDCAYFLKYKMPPREYYLDTYHMWHSIWCEAPKKLNFISSICLDYCRYWKDESKGDTDDQRKAERIPTNPDDYLRYLRYNVLDTYNTLLDCLFLLPHLLRMPWALQNYVKEFGSQVGPALAMSMTGVRVNEKRQMEKSNNWKREFESKLADLRIMTNNPEFEPSKNDMVSSMVYDVLGAQPVKIRGKKKYGERSVDENVLKVIIPQSILVEVFVNALWECKKPANNITKYGPFYIDEKTKKPKGLSFLNGRLMYQYGAGKTTSWRYASSEHQFFYGTNSQNIGAKIRDICVADDGYVIGDIDYSQSDAYFIAFESEEPKMMTLMLSDKDAHSVHGEAFFKIPYEKIVEGHANDEEWTDHPTKGVRQNSKRIVHGTNYWMQAFTMYMHLGREAVVNIAIRMGRTDAHLWTQKMCVSFCETLLDLYYRMYPRLKPWQAEAARNAVENHNRVTGAFGHTHWFFGDILREDAIKREIAAFFGQNGTAGNIDRSLQEIYWHSGLLEDGMILLLQTHDSITWQSPKDKIHKHVKAVREILEQPVTLHEREFVVPTDCVIGLSWGKKCMMKYDSEITYEQLVEFDREWERKMYKFPEQLERFKQAAMGD